MSFTYLFIKNNKPISFNLTNFSNFSSNSYPKTKIDKENWKIILGRKGPIEYAHKLANEEIQSQKPVSFKVINEILAYCNISITEEILNSLINAPSIVIKNLDQNETKKILKDNIGLPSSSSSSSSSSSRGRG